MGVYDFNTQIDQHTIEGSNTTARGYQCVLDFDSTHVLVVYKDSTASGIRARILSHDGSYDSFTNVSAAIVATSESDYIECAEIKTGYYMIEFGSSNALRLATFSVNVSTYAISTIDEIVINSSLGSGGESCVVRYSDTRLWVGNNQDIDVVSVDSSCDNIAVEETESSLGLHLNFIKVSETRLLAVYSGTDQDGYAELFSCDTNGETITSLDTLEFATEYLITATVKELFTDYYIVAYEGTDTPNIRASSLYVNGSDVISLKQSVNIDSADAYYEDSIALGVYEDQRGFCVAYIENGLDAYLESWSCDTTGTTLTERDVITFDTNAAGSPAILTNGLFVILSWLDETADDTTIASWEITPYIQDVSPTKLDNTSTFGTEQIDQTIYPNSFVNDIVLTDSYDIAHYSTSWVTGGVTYRSQSFTATVGGTLDKATWYLKGTYDTAEYEALVYAHTGTYGTTSEPDGSPLATSDPTVMTGIHSTDPTGFTFNFTGSDRITLTQDGKYCLVIRRSSGSSNSVFADATIPTHSGNYAMSSDSGGTWATGATADLPFEVYVTATFGTPVVEAETLVEPNALDNSNSFGTPQVDQKIYPTEFDSADMFSYPQHIPPPATYHDSELIDQNYYQNRTGGYSLAGLQEYVGQTFTNEQSKPFKILKLYGGLNIGAVAPSNTLAVSIYDITGTYGTNGESTGSALATSDAVDLSGYSQGDYTVEFTFSGANQINLDAGGKYAFQYNDNSFGPSEIAINRNSSMGSHGGNTYRKYNSTMYYDTTDLPFLILGEEGVQYVEPDAIVSTESFGTAQTDQKIYPAVLDNSNSFGSPDIDHIVYPTAYDNSNSFGSPDVDHTIYPTGFDSSNSFGSLTVTADAILEPTALDNSNTFGTAQINQTIYPTAFDSSTSFGSPQVGGAIGPDALDNVNTFGTAQVNQTIYPTALDNSNGFGSPALVQGVSPTALDNSNSFGTAAVKRQLEATLVGLISTIKVGYPEVWKPSSGDLYPNKTLSSNTFGTPQINQTIYPSSFDSTNTFGSPTFDIVVNPDALDNPNSFGSPDVDHVIYPSLLDNTNAFGTLQIDKGVFPTAHDNSNSFGTHQINQTIYPTALDNNNGFGSPTLTAGAEVLPDALDNTNQFGSPTVIADAIVYPDALNNTNSFGTAIIAAAGYIYPTTLDSINIFGTPQVDQVIYPAALDNSSAFGISQVDHVIYPDAVVSTEDVLDPTVAALTFVYPDALDNINSFGVPQLNPVVSPTKIDSLNTFGAPQVDQTIYPTALVNTVIFGTASVSMTIYANLFAAVNTYGYPLVGGESQTSNNWFMFFGRW